MGDTLLKFHANPPVTPYASPYDTEHYLYYLWKVFTNYYRLLQKSWRYNIPLTLQVGRNQQNWIQIDTEFYQCFDYDKDHPITEYFIDYWERHIDFLLDRQIEQRGEVKTEIPIDEWARIHDLLQRLFCSISELFTDSLLYGCTTFYKIHQTAKGIQVTTTIQQGDNIREAYTMFIETPEHAISYYRALRSKMTDVMIRWDEELKQGPTKN